MGLPSSANMGAIHFIQRRTRMNRNFPALPSAQEGKAGYILMWLLGVPIPVLLLFFLLRGCT